MVPLTVWFVPLNIVAPARHGLAISSFMILAWITEAMEYALSGLIGCYLYWALRVAPFNVAFSGFATDTPFLLALDRNSLGTVLNDFIWRLP
jgi:hypothetical protein